MFYFSCIFGLDLDVRYHFRHIRYPRIESKPRPRRQGDTELAKEINSQVPHARRMLATHLLVLFPRKGNCRASRRWCCGHTNGERRSAKVCCLPRGERRGGAYMEGTGTDFGQVFLRCCHVTCSSYDSYCVCYYCWSLCTNHVVIAIYKERLLLFYSILCWFIS